MTARIKSETAPTVGVGGGGAEERAWRIYRHKDIRLALFPRLDYSSPRRSQSEPVAPVAGSCTATRRWPE